MTPKERVLRAICHEEPDRVPVLEPYGVLPPTADVILGRPCLATSPIRTVRYLAAKRDAMELAKIVRRDWLDLASKLGFDAGPINSGVGYGTRPELIDENSWSIGGSIFRYVPETGVTLEVDSDIKREGIMALERRVARMEGQSDQEIEEQVREHQVDESLTSAWRKMGLLIYTSCGTNPTVSSWFSVYLRCFHQAPGLMRRYLRERTRRVAVTGKIASDFGCELMFIGGDIAGNDGPMVSPRIYREFLLPEFRSQARALHSRGIFAFISSDGNLWPIIDDYLGNSEVDGMMEVQVTAGMELEKLKSLFGDRICFAGSVDCQFTLSTGNPASAALETRRAVEDLSSGGGHILCSSNSIHAGVKPENYMAMLDAARKFGRYTGS